ncbi:MAG TPA: FAD-dependent oxidoreductase [Acidimicrobiales bacterium]|nr:FAD-dependent oxidoreductase [Acidimicrobiales bacterium]
MAEIVVLGAGVVGLGTAMLLAKDGHDVTVLERDATPPASTPEGAWERWERRGVNQFRLPHYFLARYRSVLDAELPDVARSIEQVGGLRHNPLLEIPEAIRGPERPDDADCEVLTGRRPVMELAVAAAAERARGVTVRRGTPVSGLLAGSPSREGTPHVVGVRTESGEEVRGDLVVDVTGRRSPTPRWLEELGTKPPVEELEDSGFMYFGRHYRSEDGSLPFALGGGIQHFGTISSLTLPADNGTWGVGIVTSAKDKALLGLRDLGRWESVFGALPMVAHWMEGTPIDDKITSMSKIEDRIRTFHVDGAPIVTGMVSVGDAWACSNPSLGRGASLGMLHGLVLCDLVRDVGLDDPFELAAAFAASTDDQLRPWFEWTRATDRHRVAQVDAGVAGERYEPDDDDFELEQALASASSKDPDLLRINIRGALVLERPRDALQRLDLIDRVSELGGAWRDEPMAAPDRDELVRLASA